ncbi:MAG TPA: protein kinase [Gemmatales bacterium]|nr:protein kinase [Gemmatales bacterium]
MNRTPIESFLDLTRKSGLVDTGRLNFYLERLEQLEPIPEDSKELANILVRDAVLSRFQADQLLSGKWRGFYVGRYRVIERIGIGGMGQVYLAEHRTMKRRFAIKVLPRAKAADPASLERFEREARAGGSIDHPNIVRAYDKDQDGDLHYLVMDFVDGCSLSEIVAATGPIDPIRAGNYLYQSALGLKHAHDSGLIHRDIKPANILIDRQGVIKILDMGLARFFNDHDDMITKKYDETVLGTADYLSPEQAIDSHSVDIRSDIYSLGCTFYYVLTGQPPFGEGSVAQKLIWHQTRTPKPLSDIRAGVPADLSAVITRCMMKKVADRYGSPGELIESLTQYAEKVYPPTDAELADLSPMARGVPFGGETLAGMPVGPSVVSPVEPVETRDPDSKSPIFDSQLVKRGGDDSTVNIRSGDSSAKGMKALPATPSPVPALPLVQPAPTVPMMVTPAKAAGIAPRPQSSPPFVIGRDPPSPLLPQKNQNEPHATPLPFPSPLKDRLLEVEPSREGPSQDEEESPSRFTWPWLVGIIVVLGILLAAVFFLVLRNRGGTTSTVLTLQPSATVPQQPAGPRTWHVARNKLDGIDFTSINSALQAASSGDTILITDRQTYAESLNLTPRTSSKGFKSITIRGEISEDGKRAKIVPPPAHQPVTPLISIEDVDGFTMTGLLIDGEDALQTTVHIKGRCPDLHLDDVRIEGFQQQGIVVDSLTDTGRREVHFNRINIRQNHPQPAQAALRFQGRACDATQLKQCRIQGTYEAAICFAAPVQGFFMEQSMLFGGKGKAILWTDSIPPNQRMNVTIQQNTFWDFEAGLAFQVTMNANDIYFTVRNNLFYQVKSLLHIDATKTKMNPESLAGGLAGFGNVYDTPGSGPGVAAQVPKFGVKSMAFTLNTSPTSPKDFLRYPPDSPLQKAGARSDPVGATE